LTENIQYNLDQIAAFTQSQLLDPLEQNQNGSISNIYTSFPLLETVDPALTKTQYDSTPDTPTTTTTTTLTDSPTRVTRPPNAYLLFNREMRKKLKQSNPNMTVGEISKEVGTKWRSLSKVKIGNRFIFIYFIFLITYCILQRPKKNDLSEKPINSSKVKRNSIPMQFIFDAPNPN
jgi:hypothetical protein